MKTICVFEFFASRKLSELAYANSKYFGDLISHKYHTSMYYFYMSTYFIIINNRYFDI